MPPEAPRTIPFCRHWIGEEEKRAVMRVLDSAWITTGPETAAFEAEFAAFAGAPHAVAVNSCTGGLFMAYQALGLGPGDEVVVPSLTWPATASSAAVLGARVVFCDVDPRTLCATAETIAPCLTARTKCVAVVHFAGHPCDMGPITALCAGRGIALVEDAAHALGTSGADGAPVGGPGTFASVYSFHPIKNITTGEGGMVTCHDPEALRRIGLAKFHGVSRDAWKAYKGGSLPLYDLEFPALKFNMPDILAALGREQLKKLPGFNARRRALARRYLELLGDTPGLILPADHPGHSWHLFVVRVEPGAMGRDALMAALRDAGVGTGLHFLPVNRLAHYNNAGARRTPAAEAAGASCLSLPLFPLLADEDAAYTARALREIMTRNHRLATTPRGNES